MRLQWAVILTCAVAMVAVVGSVSTAAESIWMCCDAPGTCGTKLLCCPDENMGMPPCDDDNPWYCSSFCPPAGGGLAAPAR
jgi:hypothetical protein